MAIRRRITSATNNIIFSVDDGATSASIGYLPTADAVIKMSGPLKVKDIPKEITSPEIISHLMERGFSVIRIPFWITGTDHADMEDKRHDLEETLQDAMLYIETKGGRGVRAVFEYKTDSAANISYKTIFYGWVDEKGARGRTRHIVAHELWGMELVLVCEACWRPNSTTNLVNAVTIYNHDDATANHDNYIDIAAANILGDVEAPIKLQVLFKVAADAPALFSIMGGRRTRGTPGSFLHNYEAENLATISNWAEVVDAKCSNGKKASDAANASGYRQTTRNLDADNRGEFYCFARLKTDDIVNTRFRFRYLDSAAGKWHYGKWQWLKVVDQWQWVNLGVMHFDPLFVAGVPQPFWRIEYAKDAADSAEFDFVMFLPRDESVFYCSLGSEAQIWGVNHTLIIDETSDFVAMQVTAAVVVTDLYYRPHLLLKPRILNRLIFAVESYDAAVHHEVHGAATDLQMDITIDYLPQYLSPLE